MFLAVTLTLCIVLITTLWLCLRRQFNYWTHYKSVPSVPGRLFSGNIRDFITFKTNFGYHLKTIYDDPKFASTPVVGVYGLYKPSLLIKDPDLIKSVLIKEFDSFHNRFAKNDYQHDPLGAQMMFFASYPLWKEMRTKLSPTFSSGKLKYMYPLIQSVGENIVRFLDKQPSVYRAEMKDFCSRYTTDVLATTVFGFQSNSMQNSTEEFHKEILKLTYFTWRRGFDFTIAMFATKFTRLLGCKILYPETERFLRATIPQAVAERERSGEKRNDIIDIFVKLKQEAAANGRNMQQFMEILGAQAGIFMVGGFETSSTTMSNCLLELAKQPDLQNRLRKEICAAFQEGKGEISYEAINKMHYLDMVIYETLRLYPVLPLLERQYHTPAGKEPYSLKPYCDYTLPEGMPIYISAYALHYDPKYWPNPTKFDPERFSPENKDSINPMVHLPFGNGPHNCVGTRLGMLQVKSGLLHLLRDHYVRVCDETVLQPEFEAKAIVLQVKGGIYLEIIKYKMKEY